ncbi:MAG TPA: hypothetical protein VMG58_11770 [Candidatus Sulfotelmatobacter sp.]|nr:hypothetical protein [Candidatus Sulfotelmatobacter sp.]
MGFLQRLFGRESSASTDDGIHLYVECEHCRSKVHVRLDPRHDLSQADDGGYFVRKEIMDGKCFRLMAAEISFDRGYRIARQEISGGRFLSPEEFQGGSA